MTTFGDRLRAKKTLATEEKSRVKQELAEKLIEMRKDEMEKSAAAGQETLYIPYGRLCGEERDFFELLGDSYAYDGIHFSVSGNSLCCSWKPISFPSVTELLSQVKINGG